MNPRRFRPSATPALAGVVLCVLLLAGGLSGCAVPPQTVALQQTWPEALPPRVLLERVPFVAQDDHLCGPATDPGHQ